VILQIDGVLTVSNWQFTFEGKIWAPPDKYHFDPKPWGVRTVPGELSTMFGSTLKGKPFWNEFQGSKSVTIKGFLSPFN
jgi:hypothetical protein